MAQPTVINRFGKVAGWSAVTVNVLGRDVEGIREFEYNDEMEKENVFGAGQYPIGRGDGNYSATASITLLEEERRALLEALPANTRLQDVPPFTVIVSYEYNSKVYKDVVHNCEFKNNGVALKQNDKMSEFKFDLLTSHITWNKL